MTFPVTHEGLQKKIRPFSPAVWLALGNIYMNVFYYIDIIKPVFNCRKTSEAKEICMKLTGVAIPPSKYDLFLTLSQLGPPPPMFY